MNKSAWTLGLVPVVAALLGCMGGGWIRGEIVEPPGLGHEEMERLAGSVSIRDRAWISGIEPVSLRVYPSGEAAVELMVVVDPTHLTGEMRTVEDSAQIASYFVNGFGVPAGLRSADEAGPRIEIRGSDGKVFRTGRAVIPSRDEDVSAELRQEGVRWERFRGVGDGTSVVAVERGGKTYHVCFEGLLLSVDGVIEVGGRYEVRIVPETEAQNDLGFLDEEWYPMAAEAIDAISR